MFLLTLSFKGCAHLFCYFIDVICLHRFRSFCCYCSFCKLCLILFVLVSAKYTLFDFPLMFMFACRLFI